MDWISPEKNRHGPNKQTTHQHGHQIGDLLSFLFITIYSHQHGRQTGDLSFFYLLLFILTSMDTTTEIYHFLFFIIYSHQHGHQTGLPPWWNLRRPVQKRWYSVAALKVVKA